MAETSPEEVRVRTSRRLKNDFVSRLVKAGSEDDTKLIGKPYLIFWLAPISMTLSDL